MKYLIIGGTGFISSRVVQSLLKEGHDVSIMTRNKGVVSNAVEHLVADRNDVEHVQSLLKGRDFDVIMDFVAYTEKDGTSAVTCFSGKCGHYIQCSTISVYMISHDALCPVMEDQDQLPVMDFWPQNPFGMQYGIDKRNCENILWKAFNDSSFPYTALRPTYVGGTGDPAARDYFWAKRILDGGPILVPEGGKYKFHLVYVDDVAQAFISASKNPDSIGKKYNIASEEIYNLTEYLDILTETLGVYPERIPLPQKELNKPLPKTLEYGFPYHTYRDAYFSIEAARQDLNFQTTPLNNWLSDTINWFSSRNVDGPDWRQEELDFIQSMKGRV